MIEPNLEVKMLMPSNASELFNLIDADRDQIRQWLPLGYTIREVKDAESYIRARLGLCAKNDSYKCGIWLDNKLIGLTGLHDVDPDSLKCEIGYWISPKYENQGIMSKVLQAQINHIFEVNKFNRIEIWTSSTNQKSSALAKKLGFVLEGTLKQRDKLNDKFIDMEVYALLKA